MTSSKVPNNPKNKDRNTLSNKILNPPPHPMVNNPAAVQPAPPSPSLQPTPPSSPIEQPLVRADPAKAVTNTPHTSGCDEEVTDEDKTPIEGALTLDYKGVDEGWDDKSGKYKIVELTDSGDDKFG
ncbi:hypothetical protein SAMD00023353_3101340 [Rosellinia necatrix]|uniref:Uncharacterized protein n=1 Tax=Rosellinia necatrix TaxID=77044 RepID=A0A1S8A8K0_ROSNE|nr:hypothetical protein SAMD00023353_3101340 [Rosellinia necatrix]